ncbi:ABC transporter substrate-binding protein [Homoserinimonas sp. OAct 916]|uniref:ABC transporter substrate-binding protein n=1 Tax=Homoserinimonas sp. OAct 916 TaxID=2211450 RepID=UPI000DBE2BEA|nr:ABC transporter substrate-binding protein [Homoserinimonas sp. OAct 916]
MSVFTKASSRSQKIGRLGGLALLTASALVLAGCAAGTTADPSESAAPAPGGEPIVSDLTLKIGTILPQSGQLAYLGPPEEAGVQLAVNEINEANMGIKVEATFRDSGDTTTDIATISATDLLAAGVTSIVGAASSAVSFNIIDKITDAGVLQISPANTSPDFTDYDDGGLYFRTAPSDLLQGEVLANQIAEDGKSALGMIVLNDPYGTGLAASLKENYEAAGGKVVSEALFNEGDTTFDAQISTVMAAKPDAIAVITFEQAKVIIPALVAAGAPNDSMYLVDGNLADFSADFEPGTLEGSKGTQPGPALSADFHDKLMAIDPTLKNFNYAAESYDAVVLLALAALAAQDTSGKAMAGKMVEVSGGSGDGTKATTFADAAKIILDGGVADYDGPSGPITFNEKGDPTEAAIGIFQYQKDNTIKRIN